MKTTIFVIAEIPQGLEHAWLQHLRDFDATHDDCHFEICADMPAKPMAEMIELLCVNPGLSFTQIFERKK